MLCESQIKLCKRPKCCLMPFAQYKRRSASGLKTVSVGIYLFVSANSPRSITEIGSIPLNARSHSSCFPRSQRLSLIHQEGYTFSAMSILRIRKVVVNLTHKNLKCQAPGGNPSSSLREICEKIALKHRTAR